MTNALQLSANQCACAMIPVFYNFGGDFHRHMTDCTQEGPQGLGKQEPLSAKLNYTSRWKIRGLSFETAGLSRASNEFLDSFILPAGQEINVNLAHDRA